LSVSVYWLNTPRIAFENAKLVLSGFWVLLLNWIWPFQVPPRASLFCMYSKCAPALKVCVFRVQVKLSRKLVSQSYAVEPSRLS
jgi:hypothetical protein